MTKVNINPAVIETFAIQAFKEACFLQGRVFTEVISEPGAFEGFPGDIVDTGVLRASQRLDFVRPGECLFSWSAEYSIYVHEGYTRRNGTTVKGRPWTTEGLKRFDFQGSFDKLLKAKLGQ